ncbi:hypothetical protein [Pseudonocardia acaciae]|nr:hypothetical protein [Pseudonocardia acaciae]
MAGRAPRSSCSPGGFAAGEIDEDEYRQRLEVLRGQRRAQPKP